VGACRDREHQIDLDWGCMTRELFISFAFLILALPAHASRSGPDHFIVL
jgi:hypothetical protein